MNFADVKVHVGENTILTIGPSHYPVLIKLTICELRVTKLDGVKVGNEAMKRVPSWTVFISLLESSTELSGDIRSTIISA